MHKVSLLTILISSTLFLHSCKNTNDGSTNNPLLAEVMNDALYFNDIKSLIPAHLSGSDSTSQVVSLTEEWIQNKLLTNTSRKMFKSNDHIEKLVEDYRNSLINYKYEEYLIATELDSSISIQEITKYYNEQKENFKLQEDIYLISYAIVADNARGIDRFFESWKSTDDAKIREYCLKYADSYCVDTTCWYSPENVLNIANEEILKSNEVKTGKKIQKHVGSKEYFLKVLKSKSKGDIAPMAYIESDIKKVLLHRRKKNLLKEHTNKLYQNLLKENKIKNYLKL